MGDPNNRSYSTIQLRPPLSLIVNHLPRYLVSLSISHAYRMGPTERKDFVNLTELMDYNSSLY